jgi:hypothetical protein
MCLSRLGSGRRSRMIRATATRASWIRHKGRHDAVVHGSLPATWQRGGRPGPCARPGDGSLKPHPGDRGATGKAAVRAHNQMGAHARPEPDRLTARALKSGVLRQHPAPPLSPLPTALSLAFTVGELNPVPGPRSPPPPLDASWCVITSPNAATRACCAGRLCGGELGLRSPAPARAA